MCYKRKNWSFVYLVFQAISDDDDEEEEDEEEVGRRVTLFGNTPTTEALATFDGAR